MKRFNRLAWLSMQAWSLSRLSARTWLILGAVLLLVLGLMLAAAIAVLSWLWAQVPAIVDAGKRIGGDATAQIEQAAPGLWEQVDQWVPGLREQLAPWLPALAPTPEQDVSGTDIGPVPRFPGLVRSLFTREGATVQVTYTGVAAQDAVVAHYVRGFADAGFTQEILSARPDGESHRFQRAPETFELTITRQPGGRVSLTLKQSEPAIATTQGS